MAKGRWRGLMLGFIALSPTHVPALAVNNPFAGGSASLSYFSGKAAPLPYSRYVPRREVLSNSPAPLSKTPHFGNIGGVKIAIPSKYWASVQVFAPAGSIACAEDIQDTNIFDCPISKIELWLRQSNYEPIYTKQDLVEWSSYHLPLYDRTPPEHRWLDVSFRADLYNDSHGNLAALYRSHIENAQSHFGSLTCDSKYGLEHCATAKEDGPVLPNEFYFDRTSEAVLFECTRLAPTKYGTFFVCRQYFLIPEIKSVAEIETMSEQEISKWEPLRADIRKIAVSLIAE